MDAKKKAVMSFLRKYAKPKLKKWANKPKVKTYRRKVKKGIKDFYRNQKAILDIETIDSDRKFYNRLGAAYIFNLTTMGGRPKGIPSKVLKQYGRLMTDPITKKRILKAMKRYRHGL